MTLHVRTVVCAVILLAGWHAVAVRTQAPSIDDFFNRFTADWVRANPNQATASRYFTGAEQDALETQLTPATRAWREQRRDRARRGLAELARFDRTSLTESQRVSADLMKWQLEVEVDGAKYDDFAFPLEQFAGVNVNLPNQLAVVHPLVTEKDAEHYIARLRQVAARMQEATAEAVSLAEKRMVPPKFILTATVAQMEQFVSTPPAQNPFVSSFADRTANAPGIPAATRERLRAEAEQITASQIYPAWRAALTALRPLEARAADAAGLSRLPGGLEAYTYHLRRFTSTTLTADEIHQIGLREVARIEREMDGLLKQLGRIQRFAAGSDRPDGEGPGVPADGRRPRADHARRGRDDPRRAAAIGVPLRQDTQGTRRGSTIPDVPGSERRCELQPAGAGRISSWDLSDPSSTVAHDEVRTADAGVPRDRSRPPFSSCAGGREPVDPAFPSDSGSGRHLRLR